jgi:arsenical pump membrane protein
MVITSEPALPVLAIAVAAGAWLLFKRRLDPRELVAAVGPAALAGLFAVAVGFGVLARVWSGPADLIGSTDTWGTAAIAAVTSVGINNLPAAALFSAGAIPHPRALLIGLNVGPNLCVTGSLAAYLWWRSARSVGARPSVRSFSLHGLVLAPAAMAAAIAAMAWLAPGHL